MGLIGIKLGDSVTSSEVLLLVLVFCVVGAFAPWYCLVFPAVIHGFIRYRARRLYVANFGAAAIAWVMAAFVRDASLGFRASMRLGRVLGLPSSVLVYLVILAIAGVIAWLGSIAGASVREVGSQKSQ
jgi:hypothetical protein